MKLTLRNLSYTTAICLAGFSGAVATYGMTKLVPGGELVVASMGVLFEAGKLSSFALLHCGAIPRLLKIGLAAVGTTLVAANIAGVSGLLSNAYERSQIGAKATAHTAQANAYAAADLVERQLAAAESNLAAARAALIKARDDRGRQKAAQAIVTAATAERDALVKQLAVARSTKAQAEGDAITAGSEFAAINFIAGATGASVDTVAHAAILTISAIPDVLAVLLLLAAGYVAPKAPVTSRPVRKASQRKRTRQPALKVVPHAKIAKA
jgi:hypothetical protein